VIATSLGLFFFARTNLRYRVVKNSGDFPPKGAFAAHHRPSYQRIRLGRVLAVHAKSGGDALGGLVENPIAYGWPLGTFGACLA
jgi:hypothetical protein